jgi:hypothetical protein
MSNVTIEYSFIPTKLQRRLERKHAQSTSAEEAGRLPRVTRLMALAIKFDGLIRDGVVRDFADLARLGCVTRARLTQIMNLLLLAPDVQEAILFLPRTTKGRDPVSERNLRRLTGIVQWPRQRKLWREMRRAADRQV